MIYKVYDTRSVFKICMSINYSVVRIQSTAILLHKQYNNSNATIITLIYFTGAVAVFYLPLVYNSALETIQ